VKVYYSGASSSLLSISPVCPVNPRNVTIQVLCHLRHHCHCVWWLATHLGVGGCLPGGLTGVFLLCGCSGHAAPIVVIIAALWGLARGSGCEWALTCCPVSFFWRSTEPRVNGRCPLERSVGWFNLVHGIAIVLWPMNRLNVGVIPAQGSA
jgi:hypothetical protein